MATIPDSSPTLFPEDWNRFLGEMLPSQGSWSEEEYLVLTEHANRLVEFTDGFLEVLPVPTDRHQSILGFLYAAFSQFIMPRGGWVVFAPLRLRVRAGKYREPDLLLVQSANDPRRQDRYWTGADLVLEVVSPDNPERDLVDKRVEYASIGIAEYWIVNPATETVVVLRLAGNEYLEAGCSTRGNFARSVLLGDFSVEVASMFDAGQPPR
ncbi:MAG TPA: Uma2 family endonuclease [Pirellulales bacterium]|nr:Uma2 family endonuclease [Pirellulales bacterium]